MISVESALEQVLSQVNVLGSQPSPILECLGQVLAEDIISDINIPPLDNSAMDGYAVRAIDTKGASHKSPRYLRILETVAAGSLPVKEVTPGTCTRIMTGAPVPQGADAIVRFEDTDETLGSSRQGHIGVFIEVKLGADIRQAGEDITQGTTVLDKGTVIRPAEVGLLASLGKSSVEVIRRPVIGILATGDELVDIGYPLPEGKIYNSNTYSVAALVRRYGGIPRILGIAPDTEDSLVAEIKWGINTDLLITIGGVSKGDYDLVKDVLAREGEIDFWTVSMKPGKPLAFGVIDGTDVSGMSKRVPLLGFPGNPVSSMITFELFARPAILKMLGRKSWQKPTIEAQLDSPVINRDSRRVFARAKVTRRGNKYYASLSGPQGSGILTSMGRANGLVIIPEERSRVEAGEVVKVLMLDWNEETMLEVD
jgi:molybdopterin molybdotransferase